MVFSVIKGPFAAASITKPRRVRKSETGARPGSITSAAGVKVKVRLGVGVGARQTLE